LIEIRDTLTNRIAEAERERWLGEIEGLHVGLTGAEDKLAQLDAQRRSRKAAVINLGMSTFNQIAACTADSACIVIPG